MKISVIGGGAWGTTLAQTLLDNGHEVIIYDINQDNVNLINKRKHPFFDVFLPKNIIATTDLKEAIYFSNYYVLSVPTKVTRSVLKEMNKLINIKSVFINVSKGIDPDTLCGTSTIVKEEISKEHLEGYVNLTGPSHAEELILRHITLLVSSSKDKKLASLVQHIFSNNSYLRVYTSSDVIGAEVCASAKNAIAVMSGIISGGGGGENARAALLTRAINELLIIIKVLGGKKKTVYGLTGIGDLIVTATSNNSRNYRCGYRLGKGDSLKTIFNEEKQTIEGIRSIEAFHKLSLKLEVELPLINATYDMIFNNQDLSVCLKKLFLRPLTSE
ncbi:MAG: NAD(P)-dependent glycerol-3-phosphate dehydrogenase [Acholeplasmatales bacterium]|jgi:glycerol-3-phosphate dehydrogenase (NAD(P)+)|nr:NAD(P)-dependent glycerol-3-phosphate dehydrogenase [Acholeplasmatales bacterium]